MAHWQPPFVPSRNEIVVSRRMQQTHGHGQDVSCAICRYQVLFMRFMFLGKVMDVTKIDEIDLEAASLEQSSAVVCDYRTFLNGDSSPYVFYYNQKTAQFKKVNSQVLGSQIARCYSGDTRSGDPVFPICQNCYQVIRHFMAHRHGLHLRSVKFPILSLDDLYAGLHGQYLYDLKSNPREGMTSLGWRHRSFVAAPALADTYLNQNPEYWWMTTSPVQPIASLPLYILSHLELTPEQASIHDAPLVTRQSSTRPAIVQNSPLLQLPPELIEEISTYLDFESVFAMRSTCLQLARAAVLDQRFWYRQLVDGTLFGWLFVFEAVDVLEEIRHRSVARHKMPPKWDWRRLVGQLAKYSSFENDSVFHDAPPGFRNRRRIWKILETIEEFEGQRREAEKKPAGGEGIKTDGEDTNALDIEP